VFDFVADEAVVLTMGKNPLDLLVLLFPSDILSVPILPSCNCRAAEEGERDLPKLIFPSLFRMLMRETFVLSPESGCEESAIVTGLDSPTSEFELD